MKETQRTVARRVEDLLARMTVEEKVAQMIQVSYSMVTREEALRWAKLGAGSFLHVLDDDARELQQAALCSRLGIPLLFGIDAIHGHCINQNATIFPSQLAAACAWSPQLVREIGRVTAREVATDGLHWTFSPVLCLGRDTRWGRVDETFGEDPYLVGELGAAIIRGYQGESLDSDESILACAKHYIGYGEAVGARDACDTQMTYRKLREVFLPPFAKAIKAGCATVMTAYGSIDGTPFTANRKTLYTILREELGFDGFVVTDWDNVNSLVSYQKVAGDMEQASQLAACAGNDLIMLTTAFYEAALRLIKAGNLPQSVVDEAVRHILAIKFRMGLFEHPEKKGVPGCIGSPAHLSVALRAARESVTLLANNGILPLRSKPGKIAVIGENANDIRAQYGDWTYFTHPTPKPDCVPARPYVTLWEGVRDLVQAEGAQAVYHRGCGVLESNADDIAGAVETARDADVIVLAVGDSMALHGETRDRADLMLSGRQTELFRQLRELHIPLITVLIGSKPLCLGDVAEQSDALLAAFNGGMFGGQAVSEALFGKFNPMGRLPISFPRHSGQLPVYYNALPGWHGGKYADLPTTPAFAFGEGGSYTTFVYNNLRIDPQTLLVQVDVANTGTVSGVETVQVYVHDCVASVMRPVKQLIAFQKVELNAGETQTVRIAVDPDELALVTPDEQRVIEPGAFTLMVGHSSREEDLLSLTFQYGV